MASTSKSLTLFYKRKKKKYDEKQKEKLRN